MLAGAEVVGATFDTFQARADLELPERLMAALEAGEAAGGDRRGRQSAAMLLTTTEDFPDLDIRVDDHADPLPELRRLLALWRRHWPSRKAWAPEQGQPVGLDRPRHHRGRLEGARPRHPIAQIGGSPANEKGPQRRAAAPRFSVEK